MPLQHRRGYAADIHHGLPTGDITHEYLQAAQVTPYISVEYGGEVSVDGGAWSTIPGSATVEGPASPLQVLTSQNRLYSN